MSNGMQSRFIPSEEIDERQVVQWRFGAVDGPGSAPSALAREPAAFHSLALPGRFDAAPLQAEPVAHDAVAQAADLPPAPSWDEAELQSMLDQARAEGHAQGLETGRSEAQQQWQQHMDDYVSGAGRDVVQRADGLLARLDDSLKQLQSDTAEQLLNLACDIARQVVRQELRSQPQALLPVVREALDMLVADGRAVTVRLNPADFAVLDEALRAEHGAQGRVQWISDPAIAQSDVRVDSGGTQVDAGMEKRWRRAVAALGLVSTWYDGERDGR